MSTTLLGLCAGTLTTLSFVPQVVKCWQRRSADELSAAMLLTFTAGVTLWTIYGIMMGSWPIVAANGTTLLLAFTLIGMKVVFRTGRPPSGGPGWSG
jgi:MtN3 and saliva related transmembrane protein